MPKGVYKRKPRKKQVLNRKLRGRPMSLKGKFLPSGPTNKFYHASIPRTLQIATRRYKSQMLRFVVNQTYKCTPQLGNPVVGPENCFLRFRANSIHDITSGNAGNGSVNMPNTWEPQDAALYGPSVSSQVAEGYEDWKERFQHFTVLGSRMMATCQTIVGTSASDTGTFYMNLAGATNVITPSSQAYEIMKNPYTKRARLFPAVTTAGGATANVPGARLQMGYSTKKFEGVVDVMDNQNLRGSFTNSYGTGGPPSENSYWTVGYVPTMPFSATSGAHAPALITIKIEYIVKLTEPTNSNQVSA